MNGALWVVSPASCVVGGRGVRQIGELGDGSVSAWPAADFQRWRPDEKYEKSAFSSWSNFQPACPVYPSRNFE